MIRLPALDKTPLSREGVGFRQRDSENLRFGGGVVQAERIDDENLEIGGEALPRNTLDDPIQQAVASPGVPSEVWEKRWRTVIVPLLCSSIPYLDIGSSGSPQPSPLHTPQISIPPPAREISPLSSSAVGTFRPPPSFPTAAAPAQLASLAHSSRDRPPR
jgi:hypothetical protein